MDHKARLHWILGGMKSVGEPRTIKDRHVALYRNELGEFFVKLNEANIYDFFQQRGFRFPRETITRYILSLMTKPFVILTGISGTGKTKIAQIFADFILQDANSEEKSARNKFIPVRPDWMDNRGLLGFFNLLDEKYHTTLVLELLLAAGMEDNGSKPFFILLDEMNLARVEQYFSDFLSIMESRTPDNPVGEFIELHSFKEEKPTSGDLRVPTHIQIPRNIFFTGTVNVDESTYMFSPKVLDRANVIEFNDVLLESDEQSSRKETFVLKANHQDVHEIVKLLGTFSLPSIEDYRRAGDSDRNRAYPQTLRRLLSFLREYNLHFGYRVINEISRFLLNSEKCVEEYSFAEAFDIQILQKILPKYHGTQAKLKEPLERFLAFCFSENMAYSDDMLEEAIKSDTSARFPRSAQKIVRMLNNLNIQGYCSFIE
jgi:5-methylcytosine-specific restriction enzyme B